MEGNPSDSGIWDNRSSTSQELKTSIGFHTFTMSMKLESREFERLKNDFYRYKDETGEIRIRPDRGHLNYYHRFNESGRMEIRGVPTRVLRIEYLPSSIVIGADDEDTIKFDENESLDNSDIPNVKGIKWTLREYRGKVPEIFVKYSTRPDKYITNVLDVTINPKILIGLDDYIRASKDL